MPPPFVISIFQGPTSKATFAFSLEPELNQPEPSRHGALFADLVLPVPLRRLYTYRVPRDLEEGLVPGCRVVVQFGKQRVVTGIVWALHGQPPAEYEAKPLLDVLETDPSVNAQQFRLFEWMAEYYACALGEVVFAALPSGLKLSSESRLQVNPDVDLAALKLGKEEKVLLEAIREAETMNFEEAAHLPEVEHLTYTLKKLIAKKAVIVYEQVRERYSPRRVRKVALAEAYAANPDEIVALTERLKRAPRQLEVLGRIITLSPLDRGARSWVEKAKVLDGGLSSQALKNLVDHGILEEEEHTVSRLPDLGEGDGRAADLSERQEAALNEVQGHFRDKEIVLLHGITGSGKTEVYIRLLQQALEAGGQALYLLPEIALTTQIVYRLRRVFGDKMGVYHSRFSDNERVEVWKGLQEGRFQFIVGVRSAVFLPFESLSLIVVDEEHETTYKQQEPSPRYHGRDTAMMLARFHGARVLLGSATPSVESFFMAKEGRFGLVQMLERFGHSVPPEIRLVDIRRERKQKTMHGDFSPALLEALRFTLSEGEQAILFQNRRGYSPWLQCRDCGWIPKCENCDVSLTYHQHARQIKCHYCGHSEPLPTQCAACGNPYVKPVGFGTEKIEEETQLLLPGYSVLRMDQDTTRRKNALQDIIGQFERGEAQVLIGTQMVTKGLDFDNVRLVGIFDIDRLMHFPDFRSHERTFQTITQVAGRAGRRKTQGLVLVQTAAPEHPLLRYIVEGDFKAYYDAELSERERYQYPPFTRMIRLVLKHEDQGLLEEPAQWLANRLRQGLGQDQVLGPEPPLIARIRNMYLQEIHIKLPREARNLKWVKLLIQDSLQQMPRFRGRQDVKVVVDVDPY